MALNCRVRRRDEDCEPASPSNAGNRPYNWMVEEQRMKREIANSNERRRMQSINAGFQNLLALLPHKEGEKLSKAAILQNTADYIFRLVEKIRLLERVHQLPKQQEDSDSDPCRPPKRKRSSEDEGICVSSPSPILEDVKRENSLLKFKLDYERALRVMLEERLRESATDSIDLQQQFVPDGRLENFRRKSVIHSGTESGIGSPVSQSSSVESPREMSPRPLTPEVPSEVPKVYPTEEYPHFAAVVSNIPTFSVSSSSGHVNLSTESRSSSVLDYAATSTKQNLDSIVEAIRLVEGDHVFQDEPDH